MSENFLTARLQDLVNWGRKNSIWPFGFGTSCCFVEMSAAFTSEYDIARFGSEVIRASPREADLMIVSGTVFIKVAPVIRRLYDQLMEPKWVISMGSCANSGGMYDIYSVVQGVFPQADLIEQPTADGIPAAWVAKDQVRDVLAFLKGDTCKMLYDLCAIDERVRRVPADQPPADFSIVYHLLSFDRNADIRVKVALQGEYPAIPTITDIWPNANWYEREVWDMFGIKVEGHPFLERILMPRDWVGHPLRKEHPARATDLPGYALSEDKANEEVQELEFSPEHYGLPAAGEDVDYMFLNLGPHHPGTHGLLRTVLQLDGEKIVNAVPDIGCIIGALRRWPSARHFTPLFRIPTGLITLRASRITYLTC